MVPVGLANPESPGVLGLLRLGGGVCVVFVCVCVFVVVVVLVLLLLLVGLVCFASGAENCFRLSFMVISWT